MPSSTSSSSLKRDCLATFAAAFIAGAALAVGSWFSPALRDHRVLEVMADRAPSSDYYQVSDSGLFGQHVFFHELYPVREGLRGADVLMLGNSRSLVAFSRKAVHSFFEQRGLSYYQLGFPDARADFARVLFEKYDLRPRLVVANADWFFRPGVSHWAEDAMRESRFDAIKRRFEQRAKFEARRLLHTVLPHPVGRDLEGSEAMVYRSISRGDWLTQWNKTNVTSVYWRKLPPPSPQEIENAAAFKAEVEARGARLVLTFVPSRIDGRRWVRELAKQIDVPLVLPELQDLQTVDGSHLDAASAARFSEAFLAELDPLLP